MFVGVEYASPRAWWAEATPEQKAFAERCYEFGKQYGRGHTLAAIAWMESSLGRDTLHSEPSFGAFGISEQTARAYLSENGGHGLGWLDRFSFNARKSIFETHARLALQIFEDNIRYFRGLGYSPSRAWFWAYPRYNAGNNWRRFEQRGEVFNARVRFLKGIFK